MPVRVESIIKAREIRVGDEVIFPGKRFTELVDDRDPKHKWTYISTDYGTTKIELDAEVTVYRDEPTQEEAEAAEIERAHRWIRQQMTDAAERVIRYREQLIESLDMKDVTWHGRRWESYAEAQIIEQQWLAVVRVAVVQEVDLIEATKLWARQVRRDLLLDLRHDSWSSSGVTNAANRVVARTRAEWVDDLRWYVQ